MYKMKNNIIGLRTHREDTRMDLRSDSRKFVIFQLVTVAFILTAGVLYAKDLPATKTAEQEILEQKETQEDVVQTQLLVVPADVEAAIKKLPEDTTPRFTIHEIVLNGNTLFTREELLGKIPAVFNASPSGQVESEMLYDLRPLQAVLSQPGTSQEVSARSIQGLTQYILSIYQKKNYAGIYVYVPSAAFESGQDLEQGVLPIRILEAPVTKISSSYFDVNNQPAERTYLNVNALEGWSPIKQDQVANRKRLDDYLNLLNKNPDRYVSAVVSQGPEENTLAVNYNVYEANPWHYFAQVDNSGTNNVQWKPRFGLINTNLLGFDDKLIAIYQVPLESSWDEEYSIYGSYDFPVLGPKLRLNLYAAYNQFDISAGQDSFLGYGSYYGGRLRYNVFQKNGWFFDVLGGLSYIESKVTPELANLLEFSSILTTNIHLFLWDWGVEMSKTDDMTDTTFAYSQTGTISTSNRNEMNTARPGVYTHFNLYTVTARHSRYLDRSKIQRLTGSFQWITSDGRLPAAKMTSFGGMYTVRGYDEYEITADGGILTSLQYEYDLVRKSQVEMYGEPTVSNADRKPFLKKLAPLGFVDYGLAKIKDPIAPEQRDQELCSIGGGIITELGENFTGTVYYGYPLIHTDDTRTGKGRLNVGLLLRW